jgi:hypothetical protein
VVDVSTVRSILAQIRRVVSGDVILPEDHNLQTDAITELTDVVETISPPRMPIILPATTPISLLEGGYIYQSAPFMAVDVAVGEDVLIPGFPVPFQVTLKKFLVHIEINELDGPAIIKALHDGTNIIATITVPAGDTGVFTATIDDYVVPENGRISYYIDLSEASLATETHYTYMVIFYMYLAGVIG